MYYASKTVKTEFVAEQSVLVQTLNEFKRKTTDMFLKSGLSDYWDINPESTRRGSKPCFDVTVRQRKTDAGKVAGLLGEQTSLSFLQRVPFAVQDGNGSSK